MMYEKGFERVFYNYQLQVVIAKSSCDIVFFRMMPENDDILYQNKRDTKLVWKRYH